MCRLWLRLSFASLVHQTGSSGGREENFDSFFFLLLLFFFLSLLGACYSHFNDIITYVGALLFYITQRQITGLLTFSFSFIGSSFFFGCCVGICGRFEAEKVLRAWFAVLRRKLLIF